MQTIANKLEQINRYVTRYNRDTPVQLLAVSKQQPTTKIRQAYLGGQSDFGENYLQEAQLKIKELTDLAITWHFIGRIQSNKTQAIAENFAWVHSVDSFKVAKRLSQSRPTDLPPLNICLQINIDQDPQKAGVLPQQALALAESINQLECIHLRGLMAVPKKQKLI